MALRIGPKEFSKIGESTRWSYFDGSVVPELRKDYRLIVNTVANQQGIATEAINRWLHVNGRIGDDSAYGIALDADLGPTEKHLLVVKTVPVTSDNLTVAAKMLLLEIATGVLLAELAPFTGCFIVPLGHFMCGAPLSGNETTLCQRSIPLTPYLVMPRVISQPALSGGAGKTWSIYEFFSKQLDLKQVSHQDIMWSVLLQLMMSLHIAQTFFHFVHYDLHGGNVLIQSADILTAAKRETSRRFAIDAEHDLVINIYPYVPVIIDYGLSQCEFRTDKDDKTHVLSEDKKPFNRSFDAYRVLVYIIWKYNAANKTFGPFESLRRLIEESHLGTRTGPHPQRYQWALSKRQHLICPSGEIFTPLTVVAHIIEENSLLQRKVVLYERKQNRPKDPSRAVDHF